MYQAKENGWFDTYYQRAVDQIKFRAKDQAALAELRVKGIFNWTEEDKMSFYAILQGLRDFPPGPIYDPEAFDPRRPRYRDRGRGLFNPRVMFNTDEFDTKRDNSYKGKGDPFMHIMEHMTTSAPSSIKSSERKYYAPYMDKVTSGVRPFRTMDLRHTRPNPQEGVPDFNQQQ